MAPARLKKRSDFTAAAKGRRYNCDMFGMQMIETRADTAPPEPRLGFTVTKKTGNSVVRNRIRRRLRELFRTAPELALKAGRDYVVVGRPGALSALYPALRAELARALGRIETARGPTRPRHGGSQQAGG